MPINDQMDKKIVIYSQNGILHNARKKQTIITYNNIAESNNLSLDKTPKLI